MIISKLSQKRNYKQQKEVISIVKTELKYSHKY